MIAYRGLERTVTNEMAFESPLVFIAEGVCSDWRQSDHTTLRQGYQYMGPGTHLKKRLARRDPGINRLDRIAKAHNIDYDKAKTLKDKWVASIRLVNKKGPSVNTVIKKDDMLNYIDTCF